ncbi:hypothetical protein B0T16DRAFT_460568 [Cercophora newfieldiana]|uniref:Uncharacterized protein n=1 Tax=Cercophora newfieldiana TaxID=92897 RepID=A0AA39Y247_9PEZI|nr:hypothetical protein B0T16DRAFT_460568 [Cercophora newfieldiana]
MSGEPELLDAFKAAALSVTKLYKISAQSQEKSRIDGYHDCLGDLLSFLDKEGLGTTDGEASKIRRWVLERIEGRDSVSQGLESDEETEKPEVASPQAHRSSSAPTPSVTRNEVQMKDTAPQAVLVPQPPISTMAETEIVVPTQDTFTFQSSVPYPQDAYMSLANLDLSDPQTHTPSTTRSTTNTATPRTARGRVARTGPRTTGGRGAGQKRKVNLAEIFDIGSLGNGKDVFGSGTKRSRLN